MICIRDSMGVKWVGLERSPFFVHTRVQNEIKGECQVVRIAIIG